MSWKGISIMFYLTWIFYNLSIVQVLDISRCSPSKHTIRQRNLSRRVREVSTADSDFTWKLGKAPLFVTARMKKQNAEPLLNVYPTDISNRNVRSRELLFTPAKRVVYYATLPDVPRYSTHPPNDHYTDIIPLPVPGIEFSNQERSYTPAIAGQDFVTRVSSSIIGVHGNNQYKDVKLSPTFTITDASPVHRHYSGPGTSTNRILAHPEYPKKYQFPYSLKDNGITLQRLYPLVDYQLPYSNTYPYYNDRSHYQDSHQTSSHYGDLEKSKLPHFIPQITNPLSSSTPYPSRHIRFPLTSYPLDSPFNYLISSSKPYTHPPETNHYQDNFNFNGLSSNIGSNFDLNYNFSSSLDHSFDLDYNRFPSNRPFSLRNKFSTNMNFDNLVNKYLDLNGFHSDYSAYSPQLPQSPDWLTNNNKPLDFSSAELDDFNAAAAAAHAAAIGDKDYQVQVSSIISGIEGHSQNSTSNASTEGVVISIAGNNDDETRSR